MVSALNSRFGVAPVNLSVTKSGETEMITKSPIKIKMNRKLPSHKNEIKSSERACLIHLEVNVNSITPKAMEDPTIKKDSIAKATIKSACVVPANFLMANSFDLYGKLSVVRFTKLVSAKKRMSAVMQIRMKIL